MSDLSGDLRYAVRGLRRSPLFAIIAILTLALGIGATTAIFTLIDQVAWRRLPVPDAGALVQLHQEGPHNGSNMGRWMNSYPMYMDFQQKGAPLAQVIARRNVSASLAVGNQTERVDAELVSGNFFTMLGVKPAVGRVLSSEEDDRVYNGHPVVVLSHDYWVNRFQKRPEGPRPQDHRQQLSDDDRRRLGGGLRRARSDGVAGHPRPHPDAADADAVHGMAEDGRPPVALGAGLRAIEARLHGRDRRAGHAGALPADPPARDDAAGGQGLDRLQPPAVHEGQAEADRGVEGLFRPAEPVPHRAHRPVRDGRPRAGDRLRQRRQPAHRPRLHAPARDRGPSVDRRLARPAGPPAPDREPRPVVPGRAGRHRAVGVLHQDAARVHPVRRPVAAGRTDPGPAHPDVLVRGDAAHRRRLRPAAGAARQPSRSVADA